METQGSRHADGPPSLATRTSTALLEGLRDPANAAAWEAWVERYRPLVMRYARRVGLGPEDAEDVAQASLLAFSAAYREGRYDRARGRLRTWLYGIAVNQVRAAQRRRRELVPGDTAAEDALFGGLTAPAEQEAQWEAEWREAVLRRCLEQVRGEVEARTFRAFEMVARAGRDPADVGAELGLTRDAVYAAKRRVLRRVRELAPAIDEIW
jgi:RNA polymerase sigma-70 factor (ECF subfamily)